jgi:hypothetical protein
LERAQSRHMSLGLLWSLDDDERDVLKRFEQTLGRGAVGFAPRIAGIKARQFGPLGRSLTATDKFHQRQHPQSDGQ